tara:strand:- start:2671 stop:3867 length:1197 start_codon:yes stop_codon:yes gene_type:complete
MNLPHRLNCEWVDDVKASGRCMVRVLIVGGGLAGLSAALEATSAGHHVVALERSSRIGGRGTSQPLDGFSIGHGPHLLMKNGPLHSLSKKLSRVRLASAPLRPHRCEILGHGLVRPIGDVTRAALNKRALKSNDLEHPIVKGAHLLANWGQENNERLKAFNKGQLLVSNEGWAGLVGRMAAALDEVGVFIECGLEVNRIEQGKAHLSDGRTIETDVIVLACGSKTARRLLSGIDKTATELQFSNLSRTTASTIELGLDSKPLGERQAIVDVDQKMAVIDYIGVQPRLGPHGSHLAAIAVGGLEHDEGPTTYASSQERMAALETFLDARALGWKNHIIQEGRQSKITLHETAGQQLDPLAFAEHGVILAGTWVENEHSLADGAVAAGRKAGRLITKIQS